MISHKAARAVAAVIETGSFEIAAAQLGLTPSAVSHRVKLLEDQLGTVLIRRASPCTATHAGTKVHAYLQTIALLERDLTKELGLNTTNRVTVRIAVNADSLGTWFMTALAQNSDEFLFDIIIEDQEVSSELLKTGEVVGALGIANHTVAGCDEIALGSMDYVACTSPAFFNRYFADGLTKAALSSAPSLRFSPHDTFQDKWAAQHVGKGIILPMHKLPSFSVFLDGCLEGLGWGLLPKDGVAPYLADGRLVVLKENAEFSSHLVWRWVRSAGHALAPLNQAIRASAHNALNPPE
ncbi:ArgP/LysG family DNA-binding transcriptional regulator [Hirschia litorea]|uniref:ArgP/LysG family DNA-binding transcriptional regulator n=1 Tax=Hirschia litorea TaxID=1199156 RepID=A0ABW2IKG2_9PROT